MPGDPFVPIADLNTIPSAMVERVEVLTGGASAVYGSDALAGVVNFIMRHDFEGVEVDGTWSINNADNTDGTVRALQAKVGFPQAPENTWDGQSVDTTVIIGANTDNGRGNVTAYVGYRRISPVLQSERDYSACSLTATPTAAATAHKCAGSSNKNRWISIDNLYAYYGDPTTCGGAAFCGGTPYDFFERGDGTAGSGTFVHYGSVGSGEKTFNYGPLNYIQRPDTKWTGGYFAHYEVNKWLDVYSDFMFTDDHTNAQIAPSAVFLGTGVHGGLVQVDCANPLMTSQERHELCGHNALDALGTPCVVSGDTGNCNLVPNEATLEIGRRDIEGGNRNADLRHTSYRATVGIRGDLGDSWHYDVYGQYGYTIYSQVYSNEFSVTRVQNALEVHNVGGVPTCDAAAAGIDGACVPLDIFNGIGSITPQMLQYVTAQGFQSGSTEERILSGSLTGDLGSIGMQSPWAKDAFAVALGAEYRDDAIELKTSRDFQANPCSPAFCGDLYGQGGRTLPVPLSSINVSELFGELRIPLVQDAPFAKLLQFTAAYRYSNYSLSGSTNTYELAGEWQPIDDFRLRGSYQRAVRAPNVLELFSPANVVLFGGQDPCATPASAGVAANCSSSHANPGADVPNPGASVLACISSQCSMAVGGNTAVKPETSDTWSGGIVLTPTFAPGFSLTIDYFHIKVDGLIGTVGAQTTLNSCYINNDASACDKVHRNALHQVWGSGWVDNFNQNTGYLKTDGWDFDANYQADLADWNMGNNGSLAFSFQGTLLSSLVTEPLPGLNAYDCKGYFGVTCGTPNPEWRHKFRVTWSSPWDVDLSAQWRHISGVALDIDSTNPDIGGGPATCPHGGIHGVCDAIDANIPAYDYFDITAVWHVWENVELRAGVNNVFDKNPPILDSNTFGISSPPFGNGNTYPGVYDPLGRMIFVGGTVKL